MERLTEEQLQAIEKRAKMAQMGPLIYVESTAGDYIVGWQETEGCVGGPINEVLLAHTEEDADFYANARTDIPALLAEVRHYRTQRLYTEEQVRDAIRHALTDIYGARAHTTERVTSLALQHLVNPATQEVPSNDAG